MPIHAQATSAHDEKIYQLIETQWGNFLEIVEHKIAHLKKDYFRWRRLKLVANGLFIMGVLGLSVPDVLILMGGLLVSLGVPAAPAAYSSLLACIGLIILSLWLQRRWYKVNQAFNAVLNPIVFEKAFSIIGVDGQHVTGESVSLTQVTDLLDHSLLITENRNRYAIDDMVVGTYQQRQLFSAELAVLFITGSGKRRRVKRVFHGVLVTHELPRALTGKTFITTERDKFGFGKINPFQKLLKSDMLAQETVLEWSDFENTLHVATTDEVEARYILTPDFMSALYDWWKERKGKIRISFIDNRLYLLYPDQKVKIGTSVASLNEAALKQYVLSVARPLWHMKQLLEVTEVRLKNW
jgi:hypothetical protein